MPQASEDVLGALYGWDSIIDDVFELPPTDPEHDEDKALDAYEEVIGTASAPADATDAVLILAAQLLTKHFFKFPHVHMNVVDIMLLLASPERSQAVRIRTIRSLLQLVTPAAEGAISSACRDKIRDFIQKLMETETSGVIVRHMTQLSKAVKENAAQEAKENSAKNQKPDTSAKKKDSADDTTTANGASRGDGNDRDVAEDTTDRSRTSDNDRPNAKSAAHHSCPPAPYVFLGNVPKNASNSEVAEFLSAVDPSLTPSCVQIKQAPRQNSHYAFVSMASVKMAHRAIEYVSRVKLRGSWNLNANYARGPPCETLVFIEMSDTEEVVRSFSFHKCDKYVWDELCDILGRFGPMDVVDVGKIRFHDVEHAKLAIRKHHFTINGMDIVPVYDPEEQLANDATRSRRGSNSSKQSFALKSGRVVGDEDSRYSRRANESEYAAQRETEGVKRSRSPSRHELIAWRSVKMWVANVGSWMTRQLLVSAGALVRVTVLVAFLSMIDFQLIDSLFLVLTTTCSVSENLHASASSETTTVRTTETIQTAALILGEAMTDLRDLRVVAAKENTTERQVESEASLVAALRRD
ncbi:TPA: hypothetical protein N0F65_003766 [Lagenidium giganteum]|uniref:RRM domain-containing protein n=1 Tax=Lagenidium giganteum TaxID=4803 RepID=A0AAV2YI70_9STRA|nr:TPA: hypothetical protein N0F65_003766 [Lagenidium giganteum]